MCGKLLSLLTAAILLLSPALAAPAPESGPVLSEITALGGQRYTAMYDGTACKFLLFLPEDMSGPAPLLVMLHGYANTAESFRRMTRMEEDGTRRGYAVAFLNAPGPDWNAGLGASERDDVGLIRAFVRGLQEEFKIDRERCFAVGFSNGGFMAQRLAAEASDVFAGVASVAATMPKSVWERRPERTDISVLMVCGTKDDVVPMRLTGSAETSPHPAFEDVIAYWAAAGQLTELRTVPPSERAVCTEHAAEGKKQLAASIVIEGGRHAWTDGRYAGFSLNAAILDFFDKLSSVDPETDSPLKNIMAYDGT